MTNGVGNLNSGIIAWFARNPVAANLMMILIIGFGIYSAITIRKQTTPDFEVNRVQVSVAFPGAAPQEVEEGIVIKIEEAIQDIAGIADIDGSAREGVGNVSIEVEPDMDLDLVLNNVDSSVRVFGSRSKLGCLRASSM